MGHMGKKKKNRRGMEGEGKWKGSGREGEGKASVLTAAKSNFWAKLWIICHCAAGETFLCRWLCPFLAGSPVLFFFFYPHLPPRKDITIHLPSHPNLPSPKPSQFEQHFAASLVIQTRFHIPFLGSRLLPRKAFRFLSYFSV